MSFCGACGTAISDTAKFCGACGADQRPFAADEQPAGIEAPTSQLPGESDADPETTLVSDRHRDSPDSPADAPGDPPPADPPASIDPGTQTPPRAQAPAPAQAPPPAQAQPRPGSRPPGAASAAPGRPPGGPAHGPGGIDALGPGAGEFASQVASQVQAPGVQAALIAGGIASAVCFGVGLLLAVGMTDDSVIGLIGGLPLGDAQPGMVSEALAQTVGLLLVKLDGLAGPEGEGLASLRLTPLTLVLVPVAACAVAAASQAHRTAAASARARLAWGAATGVPFAFVMMVFALAAGDLDPQVGGAFALGALWGAVGGTAGVAWKLRREEPHRLATVLTPATRGPVAVLAAATRPLVGALALAALIGTSVWCVQAIRGESFARLATRDDGGSLAAGVVQNVLFAADHGVNYLALGTGSSFKAELATPIPLDGDPSSNPFTERGDQFRLFDFNDEMTPALFIPLLIVLMLIPLAFALFAGFSVARAVRARTPHLGAAWGLLVGPVWATVLALLNAMSPHVVGRPVGDSLFGITLLAGAALGALGGFLASQTGAVAQQP